MRSAAATGLAALLALVVAGLVLTTGPLGAPPWAVAAAALGHGSPLAELAWSLRAPRLIAAVAVGAALAGSGAAFQVLFRNPLVAPDLLGVSSGAGLGAAGAILLGGGALAIQGGAFAAGLAAAGLALTCARAARGGDPRLSLVLCGVVVGALASAGLALVVLLADPYSQLPDITWWLLGSFDRAELSEVGLALVPVGLGAAVLLALGFRLDALALGDDQARSLGLSAARLRFAAVAAAALMTSAAVAVSGVIGWIGLLAPHAARRFVGETAGQLIPASMAVGALFALLIDRAAAALGPAEPPVGLLAAGIGAPAFLILFVLTSRRRP